MTDPPTPQPGDTGTSRVNIEEQLRSAEQRLALHVENTPLAVIEWDQDARVTRWNAQAERLFGWSADEVIGRGLFDWPLILEANRELARQMLADAIAGRQPRSVVTTANGTKSGGVVWCEWYSSILYDDAGRMASALTLALDVTERRATAEALKFSQAQMRAALDGARMLAWNLDLVSNRWETTLDIPDFYGVGRGADYSNPELALHDAVHPDDVALVQAGRQRAVETGEPMRYEFRGRATAPDGFPRWFSTRGQVLRDATGKAVRIVAVTTDVTELKRAEAERTALDRQLQDAQRWESLGVLAGGVAHDFNNILTVVLGSAGLARRGLVQGSPTLAHLDQIERACRRAADVCRQMLAYAGHSHNFGARTDLASLVRESAPLLEIPAGHAGVRLNLAEGLPLVQADPAQVRQVLVNLATNAAEAIEGAGEVVVGARAVEVRPGASDVGFPLAPPPGPFVVLSVSDTGSGMPPEVRARMFDPFFTTRFAGRGLGLAAVLGIVRGHKGGIHVATTPGKGTTVSVYWPVAEAAPGAERPAPTQAALVIDDEMYVREATASTLEEMGFAPLLAADGPSGIDAFRRHRDAVKVAVIDVMMPGMTGDQVLEALRLIDPDLPVVLMSGFTDRRVIKADFGPRAEFLQKPFHPEELMAAVRRVV